jgi:hypothetical protein
MNTSERDHILFGTTPPTYPGGVAHFAGLTLEKIQTLISKGLLDPLDSHNLSPEAQDYIDFMEAHPGFTAHGYAYSPERFGKDWPHGVDPNHSIVLEGIEAKRKPEEAILWPDTPPFDYDTTRDFVLRYRSADEFDWEPDRLYCWYD